MANLSELLNDPDYVNANEATKAAIFTKYAPSDEAYTKANAATQAAIRSRFGVEGQAGMGPRSGLDRGIYSGYQQAKSAFAGLAGRTGLMSLDSAKAVQEEAEDKRSKAFKPSEKSWAEDPFNKFGELIGQSAPFMVAPIVAGGVATIAGAPALIATGLGGLASAAQFTATNLARQQDTGVALEDTNLGSAALASIPQAAFETISFRMMPIVQKIFGAAGKPLTAAEATAITQQGLFKTAGEMAKTGVKVGGTEGMTEVGQQFFERLQAGLNIADKDARDEYLESFVSGAILGSALSVPGAGMRRMQAEQVVEANKPQTFVEPNTGITMTVSPIPLTDPNLELAGTQEVNGQPLYIYAPKQESTETDLGAPDLTSPIVATMRTTTDGKESVRTTREDGSVDVDGVLVVPPRSIVAPPAAQPQGTPSNAGVDQAAMEEEWLQSQGQLPFAPSGQVAQPAQITQPEDVQGELPGEPAPAPVSDSAAQVEQPADIVPLDDKGEPIKTPESIAPPLDPNVEAQLAAEPFDPESILLPPKEEPPVRAPKAEKVKASEKILSAHEFIASLGGLNKQEASEINKDDAKSNVRIGNKWLYASKGGLSAAQAAEKLAEAGYIKTEDSNEVYRVINESLADPVYSINDADAIAERRFNEQALDDAERFEKQQAEAAIEAQDISAEVAAEQAVEAADLGNFRQQMLDAGYTEQDLNVIGFTKASPELQAEVTALMQQVTEAGLDAQGILESLGKTYGDRLITKQEYYAKAKDELAKAIREKAIQGGGRDVSQADVQEGAAREEGLVSPSEQELKAKQEAADQADAAKAKADRDAAAKEKADAERKEIAARSEKAAGEFELGKTAEEDLYGQKDLLAIAEKADVPPVLQAPADFVLKKGRIEQVVLAARALEEGKITKAEYDKYVDYYAPIATVGTPEAPLSKEGMERVLKSNQVDKINPDVKDGTRVGLRMDINALKRAQQLSAQTGDKINGSVVSIHQGSTTSKTGKVIGYSGAASIKNARFEIRSEQAAFDIAQGVDDKSPQQTIEGEWVNISPEEAYSRVKSLLKDPAWSQVSLDPLRHSFFYDRSNKQPVVSADEILQVGRFVLAKNVKYAAREEFLYSIGEFKSEKESKPKLSEDIPNERWLQGKIDYAIEKGRNRYGVPHMSTVTGYFDKPVQVSLRVLSKLKGETDEQNNVRQDSLDYIRKNWDEVSKSPPYIEVAYNGEAYISEGNHRIMVAMEKGLDSMPVEIRYFDGGQRKSGPLNPNRIPSLDSSVDENISESIQNATDVDIANAERVAQTFGGKVVYQDGGLSLVMINSPANGDPMYIPAKNATYAINRRGEGVFLDDVPVTAGVFSDAELLSLKKARDDIEAEEAAKFAKDPYVKFTGDVAYSPSITPATRKLFEEWKKLLKLNQKIYLATNQDVLENSDKYTGLLRRIPFAASLGNPGITQNLSDGTRYILVDGTLTEDSLVEILAHEMGHAHQREVFNNAPLATQIKILDAHKQWLKSVQGKNARDFIDSLRAKETAATTNIADPEMPAKTMQNYHAYWSTFKEWYADQTARWATTDEKPRTFVERFFAKVAETLRNFFNTAKSKGFLPDQTFATYMNDITAPAFLAAQPSKNVKYAEREEFLYSQAPKQPSQPNLPGIAGKPKSKTQIPKPLPDATWTNLPDMTRKDEVIIALVDKNYNLSQVQKTIEDQVGKIQDELNTYRKESLSHGRADAREKDFYVNEVMPIIKEMKAKNISDAEMTKYLVMRHAEEANDLIAKRNPNNQARQDNGVGYTYKQREEYFKDLDPKRKKDFESIASKVDSILKQTRDILENNGVISAEERKAWEDLFEFYVPTRREESDFLMPSSGYRRVGDFSKSRVGSSREVVDVLSNIVINRLIAINRVEKERIARAFYGMNLMNPNPEYFMAVSPDAVKNKDVLANELQDNFGMNQTEAEELVNYIMTEPTRKYYNKETGEVNTVTDVQAKYQDYVLPVKLNGKDRFVFANPKNPRAVQMIQSLRGLDVKQLTGLWAMSAPITRWFASVNTQYNLVFGAFNFVRDVMGSQLKLTATEIADKKIEVLNGTFKAIPEIFKALREMNAGKKFSDTSDGSWSDYILHGGKVGYKDQFQNLKDTTNLVEKELAKLDRNNVRKAADATLNWISNVNDVLENAARLSAYRAALNKYKTEHKGKITERDLENMKDRAADIAKNLTVNFNRKGTWGAKAGSLYAFFGASVQGTKNLVDTLRGPKGKLIMSAGVTIGIAQALILAAAGFDEDEPAEFIKQKNLVLPTGDGKYIMVPMPFGFNVFPNIGRLMVEGLIKTSKGKDASDKLYDTITMLANSFNPLGGGGFWQMVTPTALDPLAALAENRDSFGRPISRESRGTSPKPGYTLSRDPSPSISQYLSEFINDISFGNKDKRGWVSPTADQLDYLAGQITGGIGREVMRAGKSAANLVEGKETPESQVPILGKLVGSVNSPQAISQRFYNNVKTMSEHEDAIKGRIDRRESTSQYMRENPEASLWRRANRLENDISKLNSRRRDLVKKEALYAEIKKIDDQKTRMMKQFNDDVKKREAR